METLTERTVKSPVYPSELGVSLPAASLLEELQSGARKPLETLKPTQLGDGWTLEGDKLRRWKNDVVYDRIGDSNYYTRDLLPRETEYYIIQLV